MQDNFEKNENNAWQLLLLINIKGFPTKSNAKKREKKKNFQNVWVMYSSSSYSEVHCPSFPYVTL